MDNDRRYKNSLKIMVFVIIIAASSVLWRVAYDKGLIATDALVEESVKSDSSYVDYTFANEERLQEHFEKHGVAMGFENANEYEKAASDVVNNSKALHKVEAEDGDDVYYLESSNELVIVSTQGNIRTYFLPDDGKAYFDRT
ncbi:MAG: hypothetical protein K6B14_05075 [Lachnospiraceae bacterium]|nr:hypothetical protein [Lachnospiraceae bacterium]